MHFEKPMNIQLFAEDTGSIPNTEQSNDTNTTQKQQQVEMVSKDTYNELVKQVGELKKQLKEVEKTGKSEAELKDLDLKEKDDELQKKNQELGELYVKLNYANASANIADIKAKISLKDDSNLETILSSIVTTNGDETTTRSKALSDLLSAVYEKGIADAKSKEWSGMSDGIVSGGAGNAKNEMLSFVKSISAGNSTDTTSIKDKFK